MHIIRESPKNTIKYHLINIFRALFIINYIKIITYIYKNYFIRYPARGLLQCPPNLFDQSRQRMIIE